MKYMAFSFLCSWFFWVMLMIRFLFHSFSCVLRFSKLCVEKHHYSYSYFVFVVHDEGSMWYVITKQERRGLTEADWNAIRGIIRDLHDDIFLSTSQTGGMCRSSPGRKKFVLKLDSVSLNTLHVDDESWKLVINFSSFDFVLSQWFFSCVHFPPCCRVCSDMKGVRKYPWRVGNVSDVYDPDNIQHCVTTIPYPSLQLTSW